MELIKPFCLWFTGLPCSGKTTLAKEIKKKLKAQGIINEMLDGDEIRKELSRDLGFSMEDRKLHIERVVYVCKVLVRNNVPVIASFISPLNSMREMARERIDNLVMVYVDTPLEMCMERDVKGMYKKAMAGEIKNFTGVDSPFEEPIDPDVKISTKYEEVEESISKIWEHLISEGYIK